MTRIERVHYIIDQIQILEKRIMMNNHRDTSEEKFYVQKLKGQLVELKMPLMN